MADERKLVHFNLDDAKERELHSYAEWLTKQKRFSGRVKLLLRQDMEAAQRRSISGETKRP
jgi:hypothetical protein